MEVGKQKTQIFHSYVPKGPSPGGEVAVRIPKAKVFFFFLAFGGARWINFSACSCFSRVCSEVKSVNIFQRLLLFNTMLIAQKIYNLESISSWQTKIYLILKDYSQYQQV